ncbi:Stp1/IreP family PP2C-type Ser/Thr phosphatase [Aquibacillus salsiterrae]|uniref:protein-serine/threonine phosphatase n=1 Tax=Aquibacillus salsiterrae TaxID=2950439 RepID=A0A9X4AE86_9BACI|nr:Stp1/IreP family PP2C-type Ser/Thr phosphatase [Aquibacillus salsiterrae]MDC3416441.1 Stp1/IreP family PP2C-type Ser/Thr phosphatase [Aquibacillus salsiterrae]
MEAYFMTDNGQIRNHNEDDGGVFVKSDKQVLAVIADGMGGHNAGDVASKMVIQSLKAKWLQVEEFTTPDQTEQWLHDTIFEINNKVFTYANEHDDCAGMGTTIVAAICAQDFITVAHIGDSRCYLLNDLGFKQVTEDHSLVNELVRAGQISKDDAEFHPRKNVLTKALGTEQNVKADVKTIGWDKGNKVLLCSDGLSNKISEAELQSSIEQVSSLASISSQLIDEANNRGGEDNISLALVYYNGSQEEGESMC